MRTIGAWLLFLIAAVALAWLFWSPLFSGAGFVGGDVYSYFFPQKMFFAERMRAWELPLWNNLTGFGYPLVAESQTGVLYPPNVLLYSALDLNSAYNANHIFHYVLAFLGTAFFLRSLSFGIWPTLLGSAVYVYGWFPARSGLEWAIIGGAWLPIALSCVEYWARSCAPGSASQKDIRPNNETASKWRFLIALSFVLALQMLAGHFCIAFITQMCCLVYGSSRLFFLRGESEQRRFRFLHVALLLVFIGGGFTLAAAQLMPTWELKQLSQRDSVSDEHDPGYGHIPPVYLTQVVASWWYWYTPEIRAAQPIGQLPWLALPSRTNVTEAHLFFGTLPLLFAVGTFFIRKPTAEHVGLRFTWWFLSIAAIVYATGWLVGVTKHLPGFSFFEGLGRFGIIATLGMAVLSAYGLHAWQIRSRAFTKIVVGAIVLAATVWEFQTVAQQMAVSVIVPNPPFAKESPVRQYLAKQNLPRVFGPGPNLPNLLNVSSVPVYLGLGPNEYFDEATRFPGSGSVSDAAIKDGKITPPQFEWLRAGGVTHVLSFSEIDSQIDSEVLDLRLSVVDPFLNSAWGRSPREPVFLYELRTDDQQRPARFRLEGTTGEIAVGKYAANHVSISVDADGPGTLIWADLFYPGWTVVNGRTPGEIKRHGMFRGISVRKGQQDLEFRYEPASFRIGVLTSIGTLVLLGFLAVIRRRRIHQAVNHRFP